MRRTFQSVFEASPDAMVIVDRSGEIVLINSQTERLFGYPREELLGQPVERLIPARFQAQHVHHRTGYVDNPRARGMGTGLELYGVRKDGSEFPIEISLSPLETDEGLLVSSAIRDVTEYRRVEQSLRSSLREKEVLLKEVHHRVKNNLSVISSMLYLQSSVVDDADTVSVLLESQDRVRAMALVHELLYLTDDLTAIDFASYAVKLSRQLLLTYSGPENRIRLETELDPCTLNVETAVPCGLILNELITNAIKHGFPGDRRGTVNVRLRHRAGEPECSLHVIDDGVGLPTDNRAVLTDSTTLGMQLVLSLARQVRGRFELLSEGSGTEARLTMEREPSYA